MPAKEMPIFTRTFDLLAWLLPMTNHFPRVHRHTVTKRLIDAAFDLRERLEEANLRRRGDRRAALVGADEALARLRVYLQLAGAVRLAERRAVRSRVHDDRGDRTIARRLAQGHRRG